MMDSVLTEEVETCVKGDAVLQKDVENKMDGTVGRHGSFMKDTVEIFQFT